MTRSEARRKPVPTAGGIAPTALRLCAAAALLLVGAAALSVRVRVPHGRRTVPSSRRGVSSVGMALTEEFIRMKVNGDSRAMSASSPIEGEEVGGGGSRERTEGEGEPPSGSARRRPLSDALGHRALSAVRSLARAAGSDAAYQKDGRYMEMDADIDGADDGGGTDGTLPGMGPSSRRTRLIDWQRRNLSGVRRDIVRSTSRLGRGDAAGGGRMTALVEALPSSRKAAGDGSKGDISKPTTDEADGGESNVVSMALRTLERDMSMLDNLASLQPQLSGTEVGLLLGAVLASAAGPVAFPGTSVTEVLAPAAAAFTASITIGSEYLGRVAVSDGKEIAANTIQCAAEAEAFLANAERVKAITPLCVGIGATCASLTLLTPTIVEALGVGNSVIMMTELYLFCPLVSVLSAAVANLALEETRVFCTRAINVGVRRFSKSGMVGRTWLSTAEQVQKNSQSKTDRWWSFAGSVLPAPIIGSVLGGPSLSAKCIIVAALAAAQSAYFLAQAESEVARATDAVALKARSAAVADTYANQGARNSAILPFTSALSAFCAAATAATVELPFIDTISTLYGTLGEVAVVSTFPILSSAFAAAAAVSKARCEVDAEAAAQAASTLALDYDGMNGDDDPILRPFQAVRELVRLAVTSGWRGIRNGVINPFTSIWRISRRAVLRMRWRGGERRSEGSAEGLA